MPPFPDAELGALSRRYAAAADNGDAAAFAAVFTPDGRLAVHYPADGDRPSTDLRGTGALTAVPGRLAERFDRTFHLLGQVGTEPDGDEATGLVYCLAHHLSRSAGTDLVMFLRYRDRYRRGDDGAWRIAERVGRIEWTETRPVDALPGGVA
ncbi:nuclear transport factor 2 family protein [Trujillonella endophytica]|uniref:SnoaL-like domain-containing protein n=1 Tax=Trujillonella endophytica TaxID=673521 RepID=A0A1H8VX22_9ACTN|nr:nuclear transport factor 2 family protein [Trujillella endophytica]SEP19864.1 SnoaL-like domain-containing protein [Trujillella endophytica]